jgi:hypothetical protein
MFDDQKADLTIAYHNHGSQRQADHKQYSSDVRKIRQKRATQKQSKQRPRNECKKREPSRTTDDTIRIVVN